MTSRGKSVITDRKRTRSSSSNYPAPSDLRATVLAPRSGSPDAPWTFLTNHSHVLVLLSRNPNLVLREVALEVGITERAVQRIIADLEAAGVVEREKVGRQNRYRIRSRRPLRHALTSHRTIGELLTLINGA